MTIFAAVHFYSISVRFRRWFIFNRDNKQASHGLWGSAGLKMNIHAHFFGWQFLPIK